MRHISEKDERGTKIERIIAEFERTLAKIRGEKLILLSPFKKAHWNATFPHYQ